MSQAKDNARLKSYKNKSLNTEEMRRRREEEGLQLRKQKKDEQVRTVWKVTLHVVNRELQGAFVMYQCNDLSCFSILQLFKRRNVATVEDDSIPEDDGMADSGYLESQANNMDPLMVRGERIAKALVISQ